jgi:hypothetical protein
VLWERVHQLPNYVYFSHAAHVTRGVSCIECHGRVDRMPEVYQHEMLSMGWCLECHRNPDARIRDPKLVFDLGWGIERTMNERLAMGAELRAFNNLNPSQDCSTCHR